MTRKLSVIIPCYNEESTIEEVIRRVKGAPTAGLALEIVAVDDGSSDLTLQRLRAIPDVKVVAQKPNRGKGAAVKAGIAAASGDIALIQDADLEYDPRDYPALLAPLLEGRADAVMGSRFVYEPPTFFFGEKRSPFFTHYIGNILIVTLTNLLYGHRATDYEGCYKALLLAALRAVPVEADGFEYDNELVCKLLRRRMRLLEVPISYRPRSYQEGKKINWRDGVRMVWTIVKWRVLPF